MAEALKIPDEAKTRARWGAFALSSCRHAEFVSASSSPRARTEIVAQWTLKRVQGDGVRLRG